MKTEYPSFEQYLLRSNKFDEDEIDQHVDSSYNQDTYMWEVVDAISNEYDNETRLGPHPKTVSKTRVYKILKDIADWTVQDISTPEAKAIRAMSGKYADAGAKFYVRHWKALMKLLA